MNLKDAFAGIREAQADDAQTLERPDAEAARWPDGQTAKRPDGQTLRRLDAQTPKRLPVTVQGTGKSNHPDFEKATIYVRRETRRLAWRKWEDAGGGDFSDLIEHLLHAYLKGRE